MPHAQLQQASKPSAHRLTYRGITASEASTAEAGRPAGNLAGAVHPSSPVAAAHYLTSFTLVRALPPPVGAALHSGAPTRRQRVIIKTGDGGGGPRPAPKLRRHRLGWAIICRSQRASHKPEDTGIRGPRGDSALALFLKSFSTRRCAFTRGRPGQSHRANTTGHWDGCLTVEPRRRGPSPP